MAFEDRQNELYERAARIEEMEGTIKIAYKEEPEDLKNYFLSAYKPRIIALSFLMLLCVVGCIGYGLRGDAQMLEAEAILFIFVVVLLIVTILKMKQYNKFVSQCDKILSFNSYGIVQRGCGEKSSSIYAYEWSEFDRINESRKLLVGISKGRAFVFPKRIFAEEEYNRFRRFSNAVIGQNCYYKNFKK